jgi:hypothetical protein
MAALNYPSGVAVDAIGDLFIADQGNQCIRKVDVNGIITTVAGEGVYGYSGDGGPAISARLASPAGVALDTMGDLFVADSANQRIRQVNLANPKFTLADVTPGNAGNYQVVITDSSGSATSSVAVLTIAYPPSILQQPQSLNVTQGDNATFNLTAAGTAPLAYQWWMGASAETNATAVPMVINGFVLGANMTSEGAGYLIQPQVQFVGGGGIGAGGYAVVSNRLVSAIIVTNAGFGYGAAPMIQIDPPFTLMLNGQTNAICNLFAVNPADLGNYFVVITNSFGSVTSSLATLIVQPQSRVGPLTALAANNGTVVLTLAGAPNSSYILQTATNLIPPVQWQSIFTNAADANGVWQFTDTNLSNAQEFYRVSSH